MQPEDQHRLEVFQQRLQNIVNQSQNFPDQQVRLWIPSSVTCPEGTQLDCGPYSFEYQTEQQVRETTKVLFQGPKPQGWGRPPAAQLTTVYWTVELQALGPEDAWDKISHDFSMLRATFEYLFATSRGGFTTRGLVQQTSFLQPAWVYGESAQDNPTTFHFVEQNLLGWNTNTTLPEGGAAQWQGLLSQLTQGPPDFQRWRQEVMSRWLSSRDSFLEHDAVFGCWQTLEHLTLSEDKGGHTDVIKSRLKSILQDSAVDNKQPQAFLNRLSSVRNDLTHNRSYAPDYSALEATRYVTLLGIHWMIHLDAALASLSNVRGFFRLATLNNARLNEEMQQAAQVGQYLQGKRQT